MAEARAHILERLRVAARPQKPLPCRSTSWSPWLQEEDRVARWMRLWQSRGGTCATLDDHRRLAEAIQAWCAANSAPLPTCASARLMAYLPRNWPLTHTAASLETICAISLAHLGVAETGTLLFRSGADEPTTHRFVPQYHLVVLERGRILATYEEAWQKLRDEGFLNPEALPRAFNFISGPSRTGDIEQRIILGAHGPQKVHVWLLDALCPEAL